MSHIVNPDLKRICVKSGLDYNLLRKRAIELKDLENTLEVAVQEATEASKDEAFWKAMEVIAMIVKVSCDLAIALTADKAGPAGKGIAILYDTSKVVVDAFNDGLTLSDGLMFSNSNKLSAIADHIKDAGRPKVGNALSHLVTLVNLANDLRKWLAPGAREKFGLSTGLTGARNTAYRQLMKIRSQLGMVERALAECQSDTPVLR
jgi:hypothetical protein